MAKIISGKEVSASVRAQVKKECEQLREKGIVPGLAVIIVGDDPASRVYVNNKKKACADVGFVSEEYALPAETTQKELMTLIDKLNNNNLFSPGKRKRSDNQFHFCAKCSILRCVSG